MSRRRVTPAWPLLPLLALLVLSAACSSPSGGGSPSDPPSGSSGSVQVVVANYELLSGRPNRVLFGLILPDNRLLAYGRVQVRFTPLDEAGARAGETSDVVYGTYLALPGTPGGEPTSDPSAIQPSTATGVYEVEGARFLVPGSWAIEVATRVPGYGVVQGAATLAVLEQPSVPAPGDPALVTDNPVIADAGVKPGILDSRARGGQPIPDPELHRVSIADAVRAGRPAVIVFSTPTFCQSRFCGPVTDMVQRLSGSYGDRADFIHVEVWKDFDDSVVNRAAADWLLRDGELNEPWLFIVGADGTIVDRWDNIFIEDEVERAIERL